MTKAASSSVETKPSIHSAGLTRRSLLRTPLLGLAAGAIACPCIASAQTVDPNKAFMSDYYHRAPRVVAYYLNSNQTIQAPAGMDDLAAIATLPYTDVIIGFLEPNPATNNTSLHGDGPAFDPTNNYLKLRSDIQTLRAAGKNVLLSVGGQVDNQTQGYVGWTSAKWKASSGPGVGGLVSQIVNWVEFLGANGVDIDYEDSDALTNPRGGANNPAGYDGVAFLEALTATLYQYLPANGGLITHSPAAPYWDPGSSWQGAYVYVDSVVGKYIAWYNTQFYSNQGYDGDTGAATMVNYYRQFALAIGHSEKILMGVAIDPMVPGSVNYGQLGNNIIAPLEQEFGSFGGVMVWEYAADTNGQWANGIWNALSPEIAIPPSVENYTQPPY